MFNLRRQHKLEALRVLEDGLAMLEEHRSQRIDQGGHPADVDRETSQIALTGVVAYLLDQRIEAAPLTRLLSELAALNAGSRPSEILTPKPILHRPPVPPLIESAKGRLAAIMEFRQRAGLPRKQAAQWVVQSLPSEVKAKLGRISAATVDSWLVKWGGPHGAAGPGREGYACMLAILEDRKPSEAQLKGILRLIGKILPS